MNIILLGAPGAGKGTQGSILAEHHDLLQISTGNLIRDEIASGSSLGKLVQKIVEEGGFPSDKIIMDIIAKNLPQDSKGIVFDGIPRTLPQAKLLDSLLAASNRKIDLVIALKVDEKRLEERVLKRYLCATCGKVYSDHIRPRKTGICDSCGAHHFIQRADDSIEALKTRLKIYYEKTQPLIEFYKNKNILSEVDGMREVERVAQEIEEKVHSLLPGDEIIERKGTIGIDF
jgi:adenylate kinase